MKLRSRWWMGLGLGLGLALAAQAAPRLRRNELKSPPSFTHQGRPAVYVDFQRARYELEFNIERQVSAFKSSIVFQMPSNGLPVFDLVGTPLSVTLDGQPVNAAEVKTPGQQTTVRVLEQLTAPGQHTLEITHEYKGNDQAYGRGSVSFGIWTSDLDDRQFLEQYLPTSFEYDGYGMELNVRIVGATQEHVLMTNAKVAERARVRDSWTLRTPDTYVTSSLFLHLVPKATIRVVNSSYRSVSGKMIPITAYSKVNMPDRTLRTFLTTAEQELAEMEPKFGAWPHEQLLIYAQPSGGGMEYNGATITSAWALGHEIAHSYLGRGFFPANGDAGWLDEAINSWRDNQYPTQTDAGRLSATNMAGHGPYVRMTDDRAYGAGANFVAHLNHLAQPKGGLQPFLKDFIAQNLFRSVYTVDFQKALERHLGQSLQGLFDQKVYGRAGNARTEGNARSPYHPKRTPAERKKLL